MQLPCLDERGTDRKRIYNYPQWLKRFKQYTKRKNIKDIGPLTEEETISETEWITKKRTDTRYFWALGPETTHQITRCE